MRLLILDQNAQIRDDARQQDPRRTHSDGLDGNDDPKIAKVVGEQTSEEFPPSKINESSPPT